MSCQARPWERLKNLASDVTLEAAKDLALREPFRRASAYVVASSRVAVHPRHGDAPQSGVATHVAARLRRWRWVLPDDAGRGVTPQRAAKEASDHSLPGLSPATTRSAPATSGPTPRMSSNAPARELISGATMLSMAAISALSA
jgi:hypothetical protein